jgi:hypothetical protein
LNPKTLAPLFILTALLHAASVATRFDVVLAELPAGLASAIIFAQLPLLLVEGYFEGRLDYGPNQIGPVWMRIKSQPVKVAFTFAFVFLVIVVLQTWSISIGPIDPTPPKEWAVEQRAGWFAMFTVGMFFPNYLAASSTLIPALRVITAPLRKLPTAVAVIIASVVGLGAGWGLVEVLGSADLGKGATAWKALKENPTTALPVALAIVWVPILLGMVLSRKKSD